MVTKSSVPDAGDLIIQRLAQQTSLRIPGQLSRNNEPITLEKRSVYLRNLLTHDPGVFLERHGDHLLVEEIEYFRPLRSTSYEIDFYMKILEDKNSSTTKITPNPTAGGSPPSSGARKNAASKNRRLAKLEILEKEGYFKLEAMRSREPYLYHLYIGQYSSQISNLPLEEENAEAEAENLEKQAENKALSAATEGQGALDGAAVLSSGAAQLVGNILNKQDELDLLVRREAERESYALQEEESETDEDEENDDGEAGAGGVARTTKNDSTIPGELPAPEKLTGDQRIEYEETFLDIMKQKFLSGQDASINYLSIDRDTSLDDHFADLERQNAEDAYFDD